MNQLKFKTFLSILLIEGICGLTVSKGEMRIVFSTWKWKDCKMSAHLEVVKGKWPLFDFGSSAIMCFDGEWVGFGNEVTENEGEVK